MSRRRNGFTLVEILVVTVVFSLIGIALFVMASAGREVWSTTDAQLAGMTNAQIAVARLSDDLHLASKTGLTCQNGQLTFSVNGAPITYALDAPQRALTKTQAAVTTTVASNITAFTPTCQTTGVVDLMLSAEGSPAMAQRSSQTLIAKVWVRQP